MTTHRNIFVFITLSVVYQIENKTPTYTVWCKLLFFSDIIWHNISHLTYM